MRYVLSPLSPHIFSYRRPVWHLPIDCSYPTADPKFNKIHSLVALQPPTQYTQPASHWMSTPSPLTAYFTRPSVPSPCTAATNLHRRATLTRFWVTSSPQRHAPIATLAVILRVEDVTCSISKIRPSMLRLWLYVVVLKSEITALERFAGAALIPAPLSHHHSDDWVGRVSILL